MGPVEKLAVFDMPIPSGKELERMVIPDKEQFMNKVKTMMG